MSLLRHIMLLLRHIIRNDTHNKDTHQYFQIQENKLSMHISIYLEQKTEEYMSLCQVYNNSLHILGLNSSTIQFNSI